MKMTKWDRVSRWWTSELFFDRTLFIGFILLGVGFPIGMFSDMILGLSPFGALWFLICESLGVLILIVIPPIVFCIDFIIEKRKHRRKIAIIKLHKITTKGK